MHRHGYQGRKFGRETDQRRALIKGLADSLVLRESIETTLPKAKELRVHVEKLITKAKDGSLHNRRQVIKGLHTLEAAHKLIDEIAPKLAGRTSGHLRVKRTRVRRGDMAQLATISFVDDLTKEVKVEKPKAKAKPAPKPAKPAAKKPATKKPAAKATAKAGKK
jgi:large subunit ribosomal protein L17